MVGTQRNTELSYRSKSQASQFSGLLRQYLVCCPRSTSSATLLLLRRRLKLDHVRTKVQLCRDRGLGWALLCFFDSIVRLHALCKLHLFFFLPLLFLVNSFGLLKLIPFYSLGWSHELHLDRLNGLLDQELSSFKHFEVVAHEDEVLLIDLHEAKGQDQV